MKTVANALCCAQAHKAHSEFLRHHYQAIAGNKKTITNLMFLFAFFAFII